MWCPYCGYEMRQGFVRLRGQWAAWAGVLAVNFEAGDDSGEGSELLPRTLFRSHERAAHCCVRCEAVLVEPKSGTYVPPSGDPPAQAADTDTASATAAPGEPGDVDSATADADTGGTGDGAEPTEQAGGTGAAGRSEAAASGDAAAAVDTADRTDGALTIDGNGRAPAPGG